MTWSDGSGYEQYSYGNSALTKIEVFVGGVVVYRIDVTTNANKQITAMKSTNVAKDPDQGLLEYTTKFTLDAQGRYTRLEATGPDGVFYTEDYTSYDLAVTSSWKALKGIPVFVDDLYVYYGQMQPVSEFVCFRITDKWGYDDNGKFVGLHNYFDATYTRTVNANGYPTARKQVDAVGGTTTTTTYQYSNCN